VLPATVPAEDEALLAPVMLLSGRRTVALTGAGLSTESGIPDYRGPQTRHKARNPVRFREFVKDDAARRRYWARATVGWPRIRGAQPNAAHLALAGLERAGVLAGVITQNVDRLHSRAGSGRVVELHGSLDAVVCLACSRAEKRAALHERLLAQNPALRSASADFAPDGDAELPDALVDDFVVVGCLDCGGPLKPDVVYFGENVKPAVLDEAWALLAEAEALLVAGSSLEVYSGRRFVDAAERRDLPIVIVNLGPTRADDRATARVDGRVGDVLPRLAQALGATSAGGQP
jgi:NAD-dependent SIR2 family protein deacetylase